MLCFIIIFTPAAIRYDIGTDYSFYVDAYNSFFLLSDYEFGFRIIVNLLNYFSLPPQSLFVFTSFLIYAPVCFFFKREGYFFKITLYLLLFYLYSYNVIRNSIALSFLLLALETYFSGDKFKAYIIYAIACLFHYSILFFIPLFLLDFIRIGKIYLTLGFVVIIYLVFTNKIFLLLNSSLFFNSKYGVYVGSVHSNETDIGSGIGVLLYMLVPIVALIILLYYYNNKINRMLLFMVFSYIISYMLALKIQILGRLSDLFSISLIFIIPYITNSLSVRIKNMKYVGYASCFLLFMLFQMQIINNKKNNMSGGHGINPYETIIY